jgi:hypothetical protein
MFDPAISQGSDKKKTMKKSSSVRGYSAKKENPLMKDRKGSMDMKMGSEMNLN